MTAAGDAETTSTGTDPYAALREDVANLVREETRRWQGELGGSIRDARRAVTLFGGAGVLGGLAAGTAAALVIRTLDTFLPKPVAALVATAALGGGGAALVRAGLAELNSSREQLPTS